MPASFQNLRQQALALGCNKHDVNMAFDRSELQALIKAQRGTPTAATFDQDVEAAMEADLARIQADPADTKTATIQFQLSGSEVSRIGSPGILPPANNSLASLDQALPQVITQANFDRFMEIMIRRHGIVIQEADKELVVQN